MTTALWEHSRPFFSNKNWSEIILNLMHTCLIMDTGNTSHVRTWTALFIVDAWTVITVVSAWTA